MKKYVQMLTGFVLLMFMGVAYAWSLFVEPLEKEFGWDRSQTSMVFTVFMVCFCTGGILGGIMIRRTSIKKILLAEAAGYGYRYFLGVQWDQPSVFRHCI